jgi:hypothetical protein
MRTAPYLIPVDLYPLWHAATRRQRRQALNAEFRLWGLDNPEVEQLGAAVLAALAENGPSLSAAEIGRRLPPGLNRTVSQTSRGGRVTTITLLALALRWLAARGDLALALRPDPWPAFCLEYALFNARYPDLDPAAAPPEAEAQAALVRRYLATYGPAAEADISFWTGLGKSETARAVGALLKETTQALVEGVPGMLLLLKTQAEAARAAAGPAEPLVTVLPADDPYTTAHRATRSRYLPRPDLARAVFPAQGGARPTLLVDGQVVGLWHWPDDPAGEDRSRLTWRLLVDLGPTLEPLIEAGLDHLARFIGPDVTPVRVRTA